MLYNTLIQTDIMILTVACGTHVNNKIFHRIEKEAYQHWQVLVR